MIYVTNGYSQEPPKSECALAENKQVGHEAPKAKINHVKDASKNSPTINKELDANIGNAIYKDNENKQDEKKDYGWMHKLWHDPIAVFTLFLFLATVALWLATRRLVRTSQNTAVQQLRAYVFAKPDDPIPFDPSKILRVPVKVRNFGQTPAYGLTSALYIGFYRFPLDSPLDMPIYDTMASKSPLAPGEYVTQYAVLTDRLNQTEINIIKSSKAAIFVSGELVYHDAFKKRRRTTFCLYSTGIAFMHGEFACYNEGNEAD